MHETRRLSAVVVSLYLYDSERIRGEEAEEKVKDVWISSLEMLPTGSASACLLRHSINAL